MFTSDLEWTPQEESCKMKPEWLGYLWVSFRTDLTGTIHAQKWREYRKPSLCFESIKRQLRAFRVGPAEKDWHWRLQCLRIRPLLWNQMSSPRHLGLPDGIPVVSLWFDCGVEELEKGSCIPQQLGRAQRSESMYQNHNTRLLIIITMIVCY